MECNRDEAVRAREIANIKFSMEDFYGAKKFVLIAQKLSPRLEGLSQMLHILEVHIVAQSKVGGTEMDWYGILQVDPCADEGAIKKQYKKLALVLHPDKNKATGAEAAFKFVLEAWETLSDKEKRAHHDIERDSFWTACPNCDKQYRYLRKHESDITRCSECKTFFKIRDVHSTASGDESHGNEETVGKEEAPSDKDKQPHHDTERDTFRTACPNCKKQYLYRRKYENSETQCSECKHNFVMRDIQSRAPGNESRGNEESVGKEETHSNKENRTQHDEKSDTVRTACPNCGIKYFYLRQKEKEKMQCAMCKHDFVLRDGHSTAPGDKNRGNEESVGKEETPSNKEKRAHHDADSETVRTVCPNCGIKYRHLRKKEKEKMQCSMCRHNFVLREGHRTASGDERRGNKQTVDKEENAGREETLKKERGESSKDQRKQEEECRRPDPCQSYSYPDFGNPSNFWAHCPYCKINLQYKPECRNNPLVCIMCKHIFKEPPDVHRTDGENKRRENRGKRNVKEKRQKRAHHDLEKGCPNCNCPDCKLQYQH